VLISEYFVDVSTNYQISFAFVFDILSFSNMSVW